MIRFDLVLEKDISSYEGEFSELVQEAPAFYKLMVRLMDDPALPEKLSPLVIASIAYFIIPEDKDAIPDLDYIDDIFLCAFVADQVMKAVGSESILKRNWNGRRPVVPLVNDILRQEKILIGGRKDRILEFIGYD